MAVSHGTIKLHAGRRRRRELFSTLLSEDVYGHLAHLGGAERSYSSYLIPYDVLSVPIPTFSILCLVHRSFGSHLRRHASHFPSAPLRPSPYLLVPVPTHPQPGGPSHCSLLLALAANCGRYTAYRYYRVVLLLSTTFTEPLTEPPPLLPLRPPSCGSCLPLPFLLGLSRSPPPVLLPRLALPALRSSLGSRRSPGTSNSGLCAAFLASAGLAPPDKAIGVRAFSAALPEVSSAAALLLGPCPLTSSLRSALDACPRRKNTTR